MENINVEELKEWQREARRWIDNEIDSLNEKEEQLSNYQRALEVTEGLLAEISRLRDELEKKQTEIDDVNAKADRRQAEIDRLRAELLDAREQRLVQEQSTTKETTAQTTEIHNHFESGSSAQVFNDKVNGKFTKKKRWKRIARRIM